MKVKYTPGIIRVASIDILLDEPNFKYLQVDCDSKYAVLGMTGYGDEGLTVCLGKGERTLRTHPTLTLYSEIEILFPSAGWTVVANENARYTFFICLVKNSLPAIKTIFTKG